MEIFQTIWTAVSTPNETLSTILCFPLYFVDALVTLLLFTTLLNINTTKKSKILYVIIVSILAFIIRTFIPTPYATFCNILVMILGIKFILKTTWTKSLLSEFISISFSSILELFWFKFYKLAFNLTQEQVLSIPIYRIISISIIYLCIYFTYRLIRYCKFNISFDNMNKKDKILFFVNALLGILAISTQFYLIGFYIDKMPVFVTIVSIVTLIAYFLISFYNLLNTSKLANTSQSLEEAQLYNKTLVLLHDNMRGFKHDFNNIVQGIGGYISTNNMDGLKNYYSQLLKDCNRVNNLTALNPNLVNNPAIYNIMATKYHKADEIGVEINLGIFMDLNELEKYIKIYELTRILGILMDNAIEAASECSEKVIHVSFRKEENRHRFVMIIENTYTNKNIDINQIFEKDFSTKSHKTNSGLGLWEIRQILKKNNNLNLYTSKNDTYFSQQFEIYY